MCNIRREMLLASEQEFEVEPENDLEEFDLD